MADKYQCISPAADPLAGTTRHEIHFRRLQIAQELAQLHAEDRTLEQKILELTSVPETQDGITATGPRGKG